MYTEMRGQRMPPGMHRMYFMYGYRTLWRRRIREFWRCRGCGVSVMVTGADPMTLTDVVSTFNDEHCGYLSAFAVLGRVKELKKRCAELRIDVSVTFADWQTIKLNRGKRVVKS